MKRSFLEVMRKFEETLTGISIRAHRQIRVDSTRTPELNRERCANALVASESAWTEDPQDLVKLLQLTERCMELYAHGELDAGDFSVKDIDEFLFGVRERAATRPKSNARA